MKSPRNITTRIRDQILLIRKTITMAIGVNSTMRTRKKRMRMTTMEKV